MHPLAHSRSVGAVVGTVGILVGTSVGVDGLRDGARLGCIEGDGVGAADGCHVGTVGDAEGAIVGGVGEFDGLWLGAGVGGVGDREGAIVGGVGDELGDGVGIREGLIVGVYVGHGLSIVPCEQAGRHPIMTSWAHHHTGSGGISEGERVGRMISSVGDRLGISVQSFASKSQAALLHG